MKHKPRNRANAPSAKKFTGNQNKSSFQGPDDEIATLWGLHAVSAALKNPARQIKEAVFSRNAALRMELDPDALPDFARLAEPRDIDQLLPDNAVHQGAFLRAEFLPDTELDDIIATPGPIVILDQVTDPQNVGAMLRSASAFGVTAMVMQTRKAPPLAGALAKAAVGAVETVKEVRVVNISRAIDSLRDAGWHVVGLAGEGETLISEALSMDAPIALVMGAEGSGLRPSVAKACSQLARIPIASDMESLNVSNAAAIAFYEAARSPSSDR